MLALDVQVFHQLSVESDLRDAIALTPRVLELVIADVIRDVFHRSASSSSINGAKATGNSVNPRYIVVAKV